MLISLLNIVNSKKFDKKTLSRKSLNRYDKFNKRFKDKVQKGFLKLSKKNIRKYQIVDSNLDIKNNKSLIIKRMKKLI